MTPSLVLLVNSLSLSYNTHFLNNVQVTLCNFPVYMFRLRDVVSCTCAFVALFPCALVLRALGHHLTILQIFIESTSYMKGNASSVVGLRFHLH